MVGYQSVEARRERLSRQAVDTYSLVAEIDGRVVGSLGLHLEAAPRRRHCGSIGMGVHDNVQGRGVGTALMAATTDLADNWLGLQRIELSVYTDNAPALHLCKIAHKVRRCAHNLRSLAHITCAILTLASLPDLFVPTYGPFLALRGAHGAPRADGWAHLTCANGRISAPYVR